MPRAKPTTSGNTICLQTFDNFINHSSSIKYLFAIRKYRSTNLIMEEKEFIVHVIKLGDVEDPDLFVAEPLIDWENSTKGKWIIANAVETPSWHRVINEHTFGYNYEIRAKFSGSTITEYLMRFAI